jgi:FRG domain
MNGQWIGTYSGTNSGSLVADLDDVGASYQGVVFAYDFNPASPKMFARINNIPKGKTRFSVLRVPLEHIERGGGNVLTPGDLAKKFPGVQTPTEADTQWEIATNEISLKWVTNTRTNGDGKMFRADGDKPSRLTPRPDVRTWEDFKAVVPKLPNFEPYRFAFRGHEKNSWRLRTSFHRTGRASLHNYVRVDVQALRRQLSGLITYRFKLSDPEDFAAFLNLAQHHGFPTPTLDWTYSPFVAAYFAFRDLRKGNVGTEEKVRIVIFDAFGWKNTLGRAPNLMPGYLHISVAEPLAMHNPRALPQQSTSMYTNIDDLETYIANEERQRGTSYLSAIDLPASERRAAMRDLALMGITAGSLFPGIDGACLQLKERFFDL